MRGCESNTLDRVRTLAPAIRDAAEAQEREGRLRQEVVEGMREAGVFRMPVPARFGGDELEPRQVVAVAEELSAADGSTGWVGTLAAGNAAIFVPRASEEALERVYGSGPDVIIAGGAVPMARARQVDGGWAFEGTYSFASGCLHADWHLVGAIVFDGDAPKMTERGPATVAAIVPAGTAPITGTWDTTGLRATASLDLDLAGLVVPEAMTFAGVPAFRPREQTLFRFSLGYFGFMPPISLGIARSALEEFVPYATGKKLQPLIPGTLRDVGEVQELVARCRGMVDGARAHCVMAWEDVLLSANERGEPPLDLRATYHIALLQTVETALEVVDRLHHAAGTPAVFRGGRLERAFRDIHTAAQHVVMSPLRYASAGRALLGLEPGPLF